MDYSEIRRSARRNLDGKWGTAIVAALVASIFGAAGSSGVSFNFESSDFESLEGAGFEDILQNFEVFLEQNLPIILTFLGVFATIGFISSLVFFCLGSIIGVGYQKFNLDLVDSKKPNIGTLFSYFKYWKNTILANLLTTVYVFLWSLLCVVPGIIAGFKYAMVPFILAENPELSANEAIERSKILMHGHKMELFVLKLSFIGWDLLCILTCGIGYIWLTPYINASIAEFYRSISGTRVSCDYNYIPEVN